MNSPIFSVDGHRIPPATDFPVGTAVWMKDCYGQVVARDRIAAHLGPYSVVLGDGRSGSTSLLALPGDDETTLFDQLVRQILGLD